MSTTSIGMSSYHILRCIRTSVQKCLPPYSQRLRQTGCRSLFQMPTSRRNYPHLHCWNTIETISTRDFFTSLVLKHAKKRTCWKCGRETNPQHELFFCQCGVVQQPATSLTFYDLLQIEKSFDIDVTMLSQRFKDMQKLLHPDKFSIKSDDEQHHAEQQSSLLNKAYSTLLKPLSRSIYLLELEDITISENDSVTDPEFLMNIMEEFEKVSGASSANEIALLEKENTLKIENILKELSAVFLKNDLLAAKNLVIKLRYFTTIEERIKEAKLKSL